MFKNLVYKLERIFRDPGLMPCEKKALKLALLENQEFICPAVIFSAEKKTCFLKQIYFAIRYTVKKVQLKLVQVSDSFYCTEDIME